MARIRTDYETSRWSRFLKWLNSGDTSLDDAMQEAQSAEAQTAAAQVSRTAKEAEAKEQAALREKLNRRTSKAGIVLYRLFACLLCCAIIGVLLYTTATLPVFGNADNPVNNEVSRRYIESGLSETGAVNIVAGMILDYRAFDTLGESNVLFIAACTVIILMRISAEDKLRARYQRELATDDRMYEPKNDAILQVSAAFLVPMILLFGIYVVMNGHISPGGGFSGGAVMGAALILFVNAFGFERTERFFSFGTFKAVSATALTFYAVSKTYSFFTGANHLESFITPGTPGMLFSAGLIPYLNLAVGLVVCCTMYAFYTLFRKGDL